MKQITKISISGIKLTIDYQEPNDRAKDGFIPSKFPCEEEPSYEFTDALQKFLPALIYNVGLDKMLWGSGEITGMAFKHTDAGIAISITGTCPINETPTSVSCKFYMPEENKEILDVENVLKEAMLYLEGGKRSQQSLL